MPVVRFLLAMRCAAASSLVLALAVPLAVGAQSLPAKGTDSASQPAPTPRLLRSHQVWRDELPDRIDPSALEVVILSPDSRCRPPLQKGLFGITVDPLNPVTGGYCRRIESFVKAPPEPLPLAVRVHTGPVAARDPVQVLAAIEPAPTRRYVALVHWDWVRADRDDGWTFEIALVDRGSGRWLWHGARAHDVSSLPEWRERTELKAMRALLAHELPRDLLTPAWWREALPLADSRWVPPAEIAAYRPADGRAGLAIVNSYYSSTRMHDVAMLKLWPAGTPEVDDTEPLRQGDWSRASTLRRAQSTPLLSPDTHALLDLPAGDYALKVYTDTERLTLAPGQITVLNIERGLGNAKKRSMETEAWWRDTVLGQRGRHAFLAEPPSRGRPAVVPYFVEAAAP